jgi:capsular exopolysaccharide synthesis family protein
VELSSVLPLLRERWKSVVAITLVAVAAGALLTWRQTPEYAARATLFVSAWTDVSDASKAYQADLLSQQKVKSYTVIMRDERVMQSVIDRLDLKTTAAALAGRVTTESVEDTVLLTVSVTDPSAARAQQIANAVAEEFVRLVPTLENSPDGRQSAVRVSVVSPAKLPTSPVSPRPLRNLALAFAAGLLAGLGVAAARQSLDTSIKSSEQTEDAAEAPFLGMVPFDAANAKNPVIVAPEPNGQRTEAYRQIRASMQFVDVDRAKKVVVITSCVPGEGKSTTACNLALSLAEAGKRVILIDGDLRRPRASRYLGLPAGAGLTSVLVGNAGLDDVTQSWGDGSTFSLLASGPVPPNPSKLLGSNHMQQVLAELRERYDMVLIDAPPVLPVADALVIAAMADGALLVVRHGKTRRDQLTKTAAALRRAEVDVLGAVLNMTPRRGHDSSYYYNYASRHEDAAESLTGALAARFNAARNRSERRATVRQP